MGYTQEEVTHRTIALTVRTGVLTEEILRRAMEEYLKGYKMQEKNPTGKIPVRDLMKYDQGAQTMEIGNGKIRTFDRVAKKYNITYSVKKDKSGQPPKYIVFFRGKDQDILARAFADYCDLNEKRQKRGSVIKKLKDFREKARSAPDKERKKERSRGRESSL